MSPGGGGQGGMPSFDAESNCLKPKFPMSGGVWCVCGGGGGVF